MGCSATIAYQQREISAVRVITHLKTTMSHNCVMHRDYITVFGLELCLIPSKTQLSRVLYYNKLQYTFTFLDFPFINQTVLYF